MNRTPNNCSLITKNGDRGTDYPRQENGRCEGYCTTTSDEPCLECRACKYNEYYEE